MSAWVRRAYVAFADFDPLATMTWPVRLIVASLALACAVGLVPATTLALTGNPAMSKLAGFVAFGVLLFIAAHYVAHVHFPSAVGGRLRYLSFVYRLTALLVCTWVMFTALK